MFRVTLYLQLFSGFNKITFRWCKTKSILSREYRRNLVKGSMTPEKVAGQNYRSQGIAPWNYARARRARPMDVGDLPPKT